MVLCCFCKSRNSVVEMKQAVFLFLFGICMVMALFQSVVYSLFPNHICLTISLFVAFFDFELYTDFTIQGNTVLVGTSRILEEWGVGDLSFLGASFTQGQFPSFPCCLTFPSPLWNQVPIPASCVNWYKFAVVHMYQSSAPFSSNASSLSTDRYRFLLHSAISSTVLVGTLKYHLNAIAYQCCKDSLHLSFSIGQ